MESLTQMKPLKQGAMIGLLGGGQLARMLCMAAARLGFKTVIFAPEKNSCAFPLADHTIIAAYDDWKSLDYLAELCDVVTYEFENIPLSTLQYLSKRKPVFPDKAALEVAQNRFLEKQFFNHLELETVPWRFIETLDMLIAALEEFETGAILKTCCFGYDGKGQIRFSQQDLAHYSQLFIQNAWEMMGAVPCILEKMIDFSMEISVIAGRNPQGDVVFFDIAENQHQDGILRRSIVPASISSHLVHRAQQAAYKLFHALDYVGVLAIEFFVTKDQQLYVNEFAPRVHNSGHWTEAACLISQFEQHIRAVAAWPLAQTFRHSPCILENLIGDDIKTVPQLLQRPRTLIHLYGKDKVTPGRKMGHVLYLGESDRNLEIIRKSMA